MTSYRVKVSISYRVEINDENETVPGPKALQGNSELTALRRALWVLTRSDIDQYDVALGKQIREAKRLLGIKTFSIPRTGIENVTLCDTIPNPKPRDT